MSESKLESKFLKLWQELAPDLELTREQQLIFKRRFRFDFVQPESLVAIEIQGGTWSKGAHSSGAGIQRDCEKANLVQFAGYDIFCYTGRMITKENVYELINYCRHKIANDKAYGS